MATTNYSDIYGLVLKNHSWVPAPRYIFRRNRILHHLKESNGDKLIEIGPGSGALLEDFCRLGYDCTAWEVSENAAKIATMVHQNNSNVSIHREYEAEWESAFDVLISCEVIEHIEDDLEMMRQWNKLLKRNGIAIISTPSDPARWNSNDVWAGHYRRYTWATMEDLCERSGFEVIRMESYGYPMVSITDRIRSYFNNARTANQGDTKSDKQTATEQSGINRSLEMKIFPVLDSRIGRWIFRKLFDVQKHYVNKEIGNGLLCWARKK